MLQDPEFTDEIPFVEIRVKLSELEAIALQTEMECPCKWTCNSIHNKARIAIDRIVSEYVKYALENGLNIPQNKLEIVKAYNALKSQQDTPIAPGSSIKI